MIKLSRILIVVGVFLAFGVSAQAADPIKERKEVMKSVGKSMGVSVKMLKGELEYDAAKAEAAMKTISEAPGKFKDLFPEGSVEDEFTASETVAKPDIWKNMKDFLEKNEALKTAALKVAAVAKDGKEAFGAGIKDLGKACKGCHEKYRLKRE